MIPRTLAKKIKAMAGKFPVIAVTGPRQSGKTTLVKSLFPQKPYSSLEDLDIRRYATEDPRGFLSEYPNGAILDEIQRTPELCSYIQTLVDQNKKAGQFILTGSQQLLLMENLSQSLSGRAHISHLLPLSFEELGQAGLASKSMNLTILKGFYPRIFDKKIAPTDWYPGYLQTYIERDVRMIKNINDLSAFQKFLKLCAARTGQLLNLSSLGNECGINHNTAKAWLGVLEASFIIHLLRPHHANFNKRMVKAPKLYFYDTGLACQLLEIMNETQLKHHPLKGNLFETLMISEFIKYRLHRGRPSNLYFWRDKTGHEIDCIVDQGATLIPIEIKSGQTVTSDFFKNLTYWKKISRQGNLPAYLIYGGDTSQNRSKSKVISWSNHSLIAKALT